jgi:hypothetical protein
MNAKTFLIGLIGLLVLGCGTPSKRYVGKRISYSHPQVCTVTEFPQHCFIETEHFIFEFDLTEGDETGEYFVDGVTKWVGSVAYDDFESSRFYLLLCKDGIVIDSFNPLKYVPSSLSKPMKISREFQCSIDFDAAVMAYDVSVVGQ